MQPLTAQIEKASELPPLVNFPGEGFVQMIANEYKRISVDYKGTCTAQATAEHGAYRYRGVLSTRGIVQVYITDLRRVDPPKV